MREIVARIVVPRGLERISREPPSWLMRSRMPGMPTPRRGAELEAVAGSSVEGGRAIDDRSPGSRTPVGMTEVWFVREGTT